MGGSIVARGRIVESSVMDLALLSTEQYCYLTTTGRVSGEAREIEIWFGLDGATLYMLAGSGEKANWVRNIRKQPSVNLRIASHSFTTRARIVDPGTPEDATARRLLVEKYQPGYKGDLGDWGRTALPVAIDIPANT